MTALTALYRLLLLAYPREFRDRHGDDAARLFADACVEDWRTRGLGAVVRRLATAMIEVPRAGIAERRAIRGRRQSIEAQRPPAGHLLWSNLGTDIRHAVRSIGRRRSLTATIIATLAIGLGTNVAIFSIIDATLLRPLPYPHADRVVGLKAMPDGGTATRDPRPTWTREWTANTRSIERTEWRVSRSALVTGLGTATRVRVMDVSGGYLDAIAARPILGRSFGPLDSAGGAPPVAVLSKRFWRRHFGESPDVIGRPLQLDGTRHTIVGVVSDLESDIAGLTFSLATALRDGEEPPAAWTVAWLRPGVRLEDAQAELNSGPVVRDGDRVLRATLEPPRNIFWTIPDFFQIELGLMAAALLILAIAGVNVSHLFLAAGQERAADVNVRRALGATTGRIARLLFVETMTLALAGAIAGLGVAWALVRWLMSVGAGPQLQSRIDSIQIDPVIAAYGVALGGAVAVVFGLWPAIRSARQSSFIGAGTATRSSTPRRRSMSALMSAETALSAVLLIVAGVVGHVFLTMHFAPRGFDADRILSVRLTLPADRYDTPASRAGFFARLEPEALKIAGVERFGIGYGAQTPSDFVLGGELRVGSVTIPARDNWIGVGFVTPGYFSLMGVPLLQGRDFLPADLAAPRATDTLTPVVVSRSFAGRFLPNGEAIGRTFESTDRRGVRRFQIIGIAGDVSQWGLMMPSCANCDPFIYEPLPDQRAYTEVLLRLRPGVAPPTAALQAAVATVDPDVPSDDELGTSEASLEDFISTPRFTASLFAAFAALAIALVAIGLSTVVSRSVKERTREMGIRLALGATPRSVRGLIVREGLRPALLGLGLGVVTALGVTRTIRSLLYGTSPADPVTLVLAPALLLTIVLAALIVPALRATRVDPARTLREE